MSEIQGVVWAGSGVVPGRDRGTKGVRSGAGPMGEVSALEDERGGMVRFEVVVKSIGVGVRRNVTW